MLGLVSINPSMFVADGYVVAVWLVPGSVAP